MSKGEMDLAVSVAFAVLLALISQIVATHKGGALLAVLMAVGAAVYAGIAVHLYRKRNP